MKGLCYRKMIEFIMILSLLLMPAVILAQSEQLEPGSPPVGQPLVSEGSFAVELVSALSVGNTGDEVEAESQLGELGIAPRNGWIADYPVTPDIITELQGAIAHAADTGTLSISKDEALKALDDVMTNSGLSIYPSSAGIAYQPNPDSCANYPTPLDINNSYAAQGPPVVTYYCPPPDFYNLYTWVPCPFRWSGLWFPGFYVLHDFHRIIHVHNKVVVITNHFNEEKSHRVFRIDPAERFRGKTYGGIGVTRPKALIPTGIPKSGITIFNGPSARKAPGNVIMSPAPRSGNPGSPAPQGTQRPRTSSGRVDWEMEHGHRD
jgi:hypothetical protein